MGLKSIFFIFCFTCVSVLTVLASGGIAAVSEKLEGGGPSINAYRGAGSFKDTSEKLAVDLEENNLPATDKARVLHDSKFRTLMMGHNVLGAAGPSYFVGKEGFLKEEQREPYQESQEEIESGEKQECLIERILWERDKETVGRMVFFDVYTNGFCNGRELNLKFIERDLFSSDLIMHRKITLGRKKVMRFSFLLDKEILEKEFSFFEGNLEIGISYGEGTLGGAVNAFSVFVDLLDRGGETGDLIVGQGGAELVDEKGKDGFYGPSSGGPAIDYLEPDTIYNGTDSFVTIHGSGFDSVPLNWIGINLSLGSKSIILTSTTNPGFLRYGKDKSELVMKMVKGGYPVGNYKVGVLVFATAGVLRSNEADLTIIPGSPKDIKIHQISPIGRIVPPGVQFADVVLWGENFSKNSQVFINGAKYTGEIKFTDSRKIVLPQVPAASLSSLNDFQVVEGIDKSNVFFYNETTFKEPEIVDVYPRRFAVGQKTIKVKGYNFNDKTSKLFIDGIEVLNYKVLSNQNGRFELEVPVDGISIGVHTLYFENPSLDPNRDYLLKRRFIPAVSNKDYFKVLKDKGSGSFLKNSNVEFYFDSDGILSQAKDLRSGAVFNFSNRFPWRMEFRHLLNKNKLTASANPVIEDYFSPYDLGCSFSVMGSGGSNYQSIIFNWDNCRIDSKNSFSFWQRYSLDSGGDYLNLDFGFNGVSVSDYALESLRLYLEVKDEEKGSYGIVSTRMLESYWSPGQAIPGRGARTLCYSPPHMLSFICKYPQAFQPTPSSLMDMHGDGYSLYSLLDFWMAYFDENSNYIYAIPTDDMALFKRYGYLGDFEVFRTVAVLSSENPFSFPLQQYNFPAKFKIGLGRSRYSNNFSWIDVADIFKKEWSLKGHLKKPFEEREISPVLKNLDVHYVGGYSNDIFKAANGKFVGYKEDFKPENLANTLIRSKNYFGANNSFIFFWIETMLDAIGGSMKLNPNKHALKMASILRSENISPCYYTHYGYMATADPDYPLLKGDVAEIDPAGTKAIGAYLGQGVASMDPRSDGFLDWLIKKYKVFNKGGSGSNCFYLDGVYSIPGTGLWTSKFSKTGKGRTREIIKSMADHISKLNAKARKVDSSSFLLHEAFVQISTLDGVIPVMGAPGGIRLHEVIGDLGKLRSDVFFEQRVFGGYVDFVLSNPLYDPNLAIISYIDSISLLNSGKKSGLIEKEYEFSLSQDYILPQAVGFLLGGAVPGVMEPGSLKDFGYAAMFEADKMVGQYKGTAWIKAFKDYAEFTKYLVSLRQNFREYFHGLWHKGVDTNSSVFHRYYAPDLLKIKRVEFPKVISVVRQPLSRFGPLDKYGIFLMNIYFLEPKQVVKFNFNFDDYGLTRNKKYGLFESSGGSKKFLGIVTNDFSRIVEIQAGRAKIFEVMDFSSLPDSDFDGLPDIVDRCPKTPAEHKLRVNKYGCPKPKLGKFSPRLTTDFNKVENLSKVLNFFLGVEGKAVLNFSGQKINLLRKVLSSRVPIDLEGGIEIFKNSLFLNSSRLPELNKPAVIRFFKTGLNNPNLFIDGKPCSETVCKDRKYDRLTKDIEFRVTGFSNYSASEGSCGDKICGITEDKVTCPADCGGPVCNNNKICEPSLGETGDNCVDCAPARSSGGGGGGGSGTKIFEANLDKKNSTIVDAKRGDKIKIILDKKSYIVRVSSKLFKNFVGLDFVDSRVLIDSYPGKLYMVDLDRDGRTDIAYNLSITSLNRFRIAISREPKSFANIGGNKTKGNESVNKSIVKNKTGPVRTPEKIAGRADFSRFVGLIPLVIAIAAAVVYMFKRRKKKPIQ